MTMQQMHATGTMACCPDDGGRLPPLSEQRPQCCSVSQVPERPFGFLVSSERPTGHSLNVVAALLAAFAAPTVQHFAIWRSLDAPRFVKAVLKLKTDLRI